MKILNITFFLVLVVFLNTSSANDTNKQIEELFSRINTLEKHVLAKEAEEDPSLTYMPGWVMLPAEQQKKIWYTTVGKEGTPLEHVDCDDTKSGKENSCLLEYKPENLLIKTKKALRGYVINIATHPTPEARYVSVSCSDRNGKFSTDAHYYHYGFMNYHSSNWKNRILFCPIIASGEKSGFIKIRFSTNTKWQPDPKVPPQKMSIKGNLHTLASIVGYW